jgi:hypothetical protein
VKISAVHYQQPQLTVCTPLCYSAGNASLGNGVMGKSASFMLSCYPSATKKQTALHATGMRFFARRFFIFVIKNIFA